MELDGLDLDEEIYDIPLAGLDLKKGTWHGHTITIEDAPAIQDAVASLLETWLLTQDPQGPEFLRATAYFAYLGKDDTNRDLIERDIIELFNTPEGLMARGRDGVIVPIGLCSSTWKFCKKHSTAILIGLGVTAVVVTGIILTTASGGAAGAAVAAAGTAILEGITSIADNNTPRPSPPSFSQGVHLPPTHLPLDLSTITSTPQPFPYPYDPITANQTPGFISVLTPPSYTPSSPYSQYQPTLQKPETLFSPTQFPPLPPDMTSPANRPWATPQPPNGTGSWTPPKEAAPLSSFSVNSPYFCKEGVLCNGQFYTHSDFLQKAKREEFLADLLNLPKQAPQSESVPSIYAPPCQPIPQDYQPIPPKYGTSYTKRFFEMFGRAILGSEFLEGTTLLDLQTSHHFTTPGERKSSCRIGGINGINTSVECAVGHAEYVQKFIPGQSIDWVYNNTHGVACDIGEVFTQNYPGISINTSDLLIANWVAFHEENKHNPKVKYLQICHSQGAIHVKNALEKAPQEIRDRIFVVAIAPAAVITKKICYDSYNYASKKDIVPYGEMMFAGALDPNEVGISPRLQRIMEDRQELILLDPHPDATGIDHDFRSPTFSPRIEERIKDYYRRNGEYE